MRAEERVGSLLGGVVALALGAAGLVAAIAQAAFDECDGSVGCAFEGLAVVWFVGGWIGAVLGLWLLRRGLRGSENLFVAFALVLLAASVASLAFVAAGFEAIGAWGYVVAVVVPAATVLTPLGRRAP